MPDGGLPQRFVDAAGTLDERLRDLGAGSVRRLAASELVVYPARGFADGWRVAMDFSDGKVRHLDVLVHTSFPAGPPRIALVEHPPKLTWPHVESDGVLCLLPLEAEVDPRDPVAVSTNLLGKGARLVEELLEGSCVERDFREEFLTYWNYDLNSLHEPDSLLDAVPPSRIVRAWRTARHTVIAEDDERLRGWLGNRFPSLDTRHALIENALFLWLPEPPLPALYPHRAKDVGRLADLAGATELLHRSMEKMPNSLVTAIGANGRGGPGLVSVTIVKPRRRSSTGPERSRSANRGFRPGRVPAEIAISRMLGDEPVRRMAVRRADHGWIHGRGNDARALELAGKRAVVVGCGSVGAPVAQALAQAGVGRLDLVDHDTLGWANVGRHPLGAGSVGANKADELARAIRGRFPHLAVTGLPMDSFNLTEACPDILANADVVVAATGSWAAEFALDRWHEEIDRRIPIVYGWTETHAVAGHAVAIVSPGESLSSGIGETGVPKLRLLEWPDGDRALEEPACGAHYHPYGPVELGYVTSLVADLTVECLLGVVRRAKHRIWVAGRSRVTALGGQPTEDWDRLGLADGARQAEVPWPNGADGDRP